MQGEAGSGLRAEADRLLRRAASDGRIIGLAGGLPSERQFPRGELAQSFLRCLGQQGTPALQYGWPEGLEGLRRRIALDLGRRGMTVGAERVIITSGAQQALAIAQEVLRPSGGLFGVDPASYPAALDLFSAHGTLVPLEQPGAVRYVMPAVANPTGRAMDEAQTQRLLSQDEPIIEDEAYAPLRFDGAAPTPLAARAPHQVWLVGTFSKTLCPGLRVGWLVPPADHLKEAVSTKQRRDLQSNSLAQAIVEDYLGRVDFDGRLHRLRTFYRRRAEIMARALRRHLPSWRFRFPDGAFSLWVEPDDRVDELGFLQAALKAGVSFDPGFTFRAETREAPPALRLCYSAAPRPALEEGIKRLATAWRSYCATGSLDGPCRDWV